MVISELSNINNVDKSVATIYDLFWKVSDDECSEVASQLDDVRNNNNLIGKTEIEKEVDVEIHPEQNLNNIDNENCIKDNESKVSIDDEKLDELRNGGEIPVNDGTYVSDELKKHCVNHFLPTQIQSEIPTTMTLKNKDIEKLVERWRNAETQNENERNMYVERWSYVTRLTQSHGIIGEAIRDSHNNANKSILYAKQEEIEIMCLEVMYSTNVLVFYNIIQ